MATLELSGAEAKIYRYCNTEFDKPERDVGATSDHREECDERGRFTAYKPNYMIQQWTDGDESSMEAHYSFRAMLSDPDCMSRYRQRNDDGERLATPEETWKCLTNFYKRREFFFSYTGEFDFYWLGERPSSPVVNRLNNPAIHGRQYINKEIMSAAFLRWVDIGLEHLSNGQSNDVDERVAGGRLRTQVESENDNHEYFDTLSRGTNYVSIEGRFEFGGNGNKRECKNSWKCVDHWASIKLFYFNEDSDVTWGSLANKDVSFADYERARFIVSDTGPIGLPWLPKAEIAVEWVIGDKLLATDSYNISLRLPVRITFPWVEKINPQLYVRYHNGPMNTLSNYTASQDAFGVGLTFKP
jgi:hypothetical protein